MLCSPTRRFAERPLFPISVSRFLLLFLCASIGIHAAGQSPDDDGHLHEDESLAAAGQGLDLLCGVASLSAAAKLLGKQEFRLQNLAADPRFVTPAEGSSLRQLEEAASSLGLFSEAVGNLSVKGLADLPYLTILHVRQHSDSENFNHYELFIYAKDDSARLYDSNSGLFWEDLGILGVRMNGQGLLVSKVPIVLEEDGSRWRPILLILSVVFLSIGLFSFAISGEKVRGMLRFLRILGPPENSH